MGRAETWNQPFVAFTALALVMANGCSWGWRGSTVRAMPWLAPSVPGTS